MIKVFFLFLLITSYVPMAGGKNGGDCIGRPWQNCKVQNGDAACTFDIPRYSMIELIGEARKKAEENGFPWYMRCKDRGGPDVGIDIALVSDDVDLDLYRANELWGHEHSLVKVWLDPNEFFEELERREKLDALNR